jgi:agmatine deiminase
LENVYFSDLLPVKFAHDFDKIKNTLNKHNILYKFIKNTKDIWCRDYLPIKVNDKKFIQFQYDPNYLKNYKHLKTNPIYLHRQLNIKPIISNINIDGGNIIKNKDIAIMTNKIFKENKNFKKNGLINKLINLLEIKKLIIIPKQPYDRYGHSDSMIRFIDKNTVLVNDFSLENKNYILKILKILKENGLDFIILTYPKSFFNKYKWGAYLNFIEINNIIFLPIYGIEEDNYVINFFELIFPNKKIEPIKIPNIIKQGGALHCITWTK